MATVFLHGKRLKLDPTTAIGKGGEADVYRLDQQTAVKIWKGPHHPDVINNPIEQAAARQRLREHQDKMPAFPKGLPHNVVQPIDLVLNKKGNIVGYTMSLVPRAEVLLRYSNRSFRQTSVDVLTVRDIFINLAETVNALHAKQVVVGDFNDLNELVRDRDVYLIDVDSFQFSKFFCRAYTTKFLDPLLVDPSSKGLQLDHPHNKNSDWYAYAIMLMQSLLFVGPYGGVYRPQNKAKRITQDQRPRQRVTVFDPKVRYPKFGVPWQALSDDLIQTFQDIFIKDRREPFPIKFLQQAPWTRCTSCGIEHAQRQCPGCAAISPVPPLVQEIRGKLTVTTLLKTKGVVVYASAHDKIRWIVHEQGRFLRETGETILVGDRKPYQKFRILGKQTVYGTGAGFLQLIDDFQSKGERLAVDNTSEHVPAFETNKHALYWIDSGSLYYQEIQKRPKVIGQVLHHQTRFWVGPDFGFGYYRAGEMAIAFVFTAQRAGINDQVELPELRKRIISARAYLGSRLCWLLTEVMEAGVIKHYCSVINPLGSVVAHEEAIEGDDHWLGRSIHGKVAAGKSLYDATDEGLARIDLSKHGAEQVRLFPDTEPYVEENCELLLGSTGIIVIKPKTIQLLEMG